MEKRELATEIENKQITVKAAIRERIEEQCKSYLHIYNIMLDTFTRLGMKKEIKEVEIKKSVIHQQLDTIDDDTEIMYLHIINTLRGKNE